MQYPGKRKYSEEDAMRTKTLTLALAAIVAVITINLAVAPAFGQDLEVKDVEVEARRMEGSSNAYEFTGRMAVVMPAEKTNQGGNRSDCTNGACNDGWNLNAPEEGGYWFQGATSDHNTVFMGGPKEAFEGLAAVRSKAISPLGAIGLGFGGLIILALLVAFAILAKMAMSRQSEPTTEA